MFGIAPTPLFTFHRRLDPTPALGEAALRWLGVVLYLVGTHLRTRAEEGLLLRQFGDEYARYAAEVPALVPWRFSHRREPPSATERG